jgi:hypothetical protein
MLELLIVIGRALASALRGHWKSVLENRALRQQLTVLRTTTLSDHEVLKRGFRRQHGTVVGNRGAVVLERDLIPNDGRVRHVFEIRALF